jgi:hypothetical protein
MFRDVLADRLETTSQVLEALDNEPKALETVTEAVAIYSDLNGKRPDRHTGRPARTLQQAALLAHMGRHSEALAAIEPAVQLYRRLTIKEKDYTHSGKFGIRADVGLPISIQSDCTIVAGYLRKAPKISSLPMAKSSDWRPLNERAAIPCLHHDRSVDHQCWDCCLGSGVGNCWI